MFNNLDNQGLFDAMNLPGLTKNQSRIVSLLDQILEKAQEEDSMVKLDSAINKHKFLPGVSFTLHFGKVLREELLKEFGGENADNNNNSLDRLK